MKKCIDWLVTIGSALSQLLYVIFSFSGNSNLSICGEAYYNRNKSKLRWYWYKLINMCFFFQKNHCEWAYKNDLKFAIWYIKRDIEMNKKEI